MVHVVALLPLVFMRVGVVVYFNQEGHRRAGQTQ
jgi:hypothetical protein